MSKGRCANALERARVAPEYYLARFRPEWRGVSLLEVLASVYGVDEGDRIRPCGWTCCGRKHWAETAVSPPVCTTGSSSSLVAKAAVSTAIAGSGSTDQTSYQNGRFRGCLFSRAFFIRRSAKTAVSPTLLLGGNFRQTDETAVSP
jgi:hypothetical protein